MRRDATCWNGQPSRTKQVGPRGLALVLLKELQAGLEQRGWSCEWDRLKADLDSLQEVTVPATGRPFVIRTQTHGAAGQALQAAGVALVPVVRPLVEKLP
jgi:hypothetical protein